MTIHAFSYGGGVQSTAALVLAARGKIEPHLFIFANVGADSEHPDTLAYIADVARPYAAEWGLEFIEVRRQKRDGSTPTLLEHIAQRERSLPIPIRMAGNGAPGRRSCTQDFKILPIARYLKTRGATASDPATVHLGISLDEWQRMRKDSDQAWTTLAYPLIDLHLTRADCLDIIKAAGLPEPRKSACWFCPYHRLGEWRRMKNEELPLFDRTVALERMLNTRRATLGKDPIFFASNCKPLDQAIAGDALQLPLAFEEDTCESGYCMI